MMNAQTPLQKAIEEAGSQSALAEKINRAQGHVYYWLHHAKNGVPPDAAIEIERALGGAVTRHDLRPDIFGAAPARKENAQ